jgi:phosphatidylserine/phosphatidylglycerophosphate/cardiolipin synthase-like enzyme
MRSVSVVTIAALVSAAGAVLHDNQGAKYTAAAYAATSAPAAVSVRHVYFSPASNLEQVDAGLIRQARSSITIAMYTFTDRDLAYALVEAARRGIQIRIYRDDDQFHQEQHRGSDVLRILQSQPTIQIRVKTGRELMHEKVVLIDDRIIRDGSGNWSVSAARYQDNEITVSFDPEEIKAFQQDFAGMWARPDNQIVQ